MSAGSWQRLLSGARSDRALSRARAIGDDLLGRPADCVDLRGEAGLALLFHELGRRFDDDRFRAEAERRLDRMVDGVADTPLPPGLHAGFAGVAWVLTHLSPDPAALGELDQILLAFLREPIARRNFDLVLGVSGVGVYALERLRRQPGRELLEQCVAEVARLAEPLDGGIAWRSFPEQMMPDDAAKFPDGRFDLGMAHGAPGAVAFLAACVGAGVDAAAPLLADAAAWLERQRLPSQGYASMLGQRVPARLAWCYGDGGVAVALMSAGQALGQARWHELGHVLAVGAAARTAEESRVVDGGLCHGAAGLALIFQRLFVTTGDASFRRAADGWADWLLEPRCPIDGDDADASFLTGAAGEALTLLALTSASEPGWDRLLLLSS